MSLTKRELDLAPGFAPELDHDEVACFCDWWQQSEIEMAATDALAATCQVNPTNNPQKLNKVVAVGTASLSRSELPSDNDVPF